MTRARDIANLVDANGDIVAGALDNVPAADLVNDTTPQLGGNLDGQGNDITNVDNVGVGVSTASATLHVNKGSDANSAFPSGNWAAKIFNQTDNSTEGGLIVANRWASTASTAFEVGGLFDAGNGYDQFFKVDGSGNALTPNQPMFMADMRGNGSVNSSGVLPFSNVRLNNGGHYNTTNRRFTAGIAGKYMFQYGFLVRNAVMSSRLQVNGSDTASGRTGYCDCLPNSGNIGLEIMACGSEILSLSANDYVHVHVSFHAGGDIYAEDISYFNGFLIG